MTLRIALIAAMVAVMSLCVFGCDFNNINSQGLPDQWEGDEPKECDDGADNDRNGLFDCYDPGCGNAPVCIGFTGDDDDDATGSDDDDDTGDDDTTSDDDDDDTTEECTDNDNDGWTTCDGDCNDDFDFVYPGATEECDFEDNDCDGDIDEDFDQDGDGYMTECGSGLGLDCDDEDADVHPGAFEYCDGVDNDCDWTADEGDVDFDGDGWRPCDGDCNDYNAGINPDATEIPGNSNDEDCDGLVE